MSYNPYTPPNHPDSRADPTYGNQRSIWQRVVPKRPG